MAPRAARRPAWPALAPPAASPEDPCPQYPVPVSAGLDLGLLLSGRVPPRCYRATVQADRDSPLAVNAPRSAGARRRSTGRAFTLVVDGLEPAQVLLHKRCSNRAHDRLNLRQAVTATLNAPVASVAQAGMAVACRGVDGPEDEDPRLGRRLAHQLPPRVITLWQPVGLGQGPRWPAQASTRYRRRSPATYTPGQAGGAGQCAGWPWAPAALPNRKHRPTAGWNA